MIEEVKLEQIKILYLITELNVGGAEKALARTVAHLDRDRYDALVACLYAPGLVANEIRTAGNKVINLDMQSRIDLRVFKRLFKLLRQEGIQIIHSYLFHANLLARLVARLARAPIIISSERTMEMEGRIRLLVNRLTSPLADRVIAVSQQVCDFAASRIGIPLEKLVVIYNGIEPSTYQVEVNVAEVHKELGVDPTCTVVGTVSRLDEAKGIRYLLQAVPWVIAQYPKVIFLIVGNGSQRRELERLAQDLSIQSQVIFTGYRPDVVRMLAIVNVFVLPSLYEGFPNVILEAMAMSKPVVATRVGGVPEAVEGGVTGLLVPPRDPEALAKAIITLLQDREQAGTMGRAGQERVERYFSVERMIQETEALYEELVREKMGLEWVEREGWQSI
jgi:glycosyltransferase involved in cell wall biosynthesis